MGDPTEVTGETEITRIILDAALEVFSEKGYFGARVDEIAERAQVNKASLYYHIGDKNAIYRDVLLRVMEQVTQSLPEIVNEAASAREKLHNIIRQMVDTARGNPSFPRLMLREIAEGGSNLPDPVREGLAGIFRVVRDLLHEGQRQGEFRSISPRQTHFTIVGNVLFLTANPSFLEEIGRFSEGEEIPPGGEPAIGADQMIDLLFHGLLTDSTEGDPSE